MKIRWKNTEIKPFTDAKWMLFMCKYPGLFLIPTVFLTAFGVYFYTIFTQLENGQRETVYVGRLKTLYDGFGKWGVISFFLFIALCSYHLFWIYAIRDPKRKNNFFFESNPCTSDDYL